MRSAFLILFLGLTVSFAQTITGRYPQASERDLTDDDFKDMYEFELRLMRNEIFARYGYIFKSEDLKTHFGAQPWYKPLSAKLPKVTAMEARNVEKIALREKAIGEQMKVFRTAVKSLPFLSLPYDLEKEPENVVQIKDSEFPPYLLRDDHENQPTLVGLLPDTSTLYALVWRRIETDRATKTLRIPRFHITTFGKQFNLLGTSKITIWHKENTFRGCQATSPGTYRSTIDADWSWSSVFSQFIKCGADAYGSGVVVNIGGKVNASGFITVKFNSDPDP